MDLSSWKDMESAELVVIPTAATKLAKVNRGLVPMPSFEEAHKSLMRADPLKTPTYDITAQRVRYHSIARRARRKTHPPAGRDPNRRMRDQ